MSSITSDAVAGVICVYAKTCNYARFIEEVIRSSDGINWYYNVHQFDGDSMLRCGALERVPDNSYNPSVLFPRI